MFGKKYICEHCKATVKKVDNFGLCNNCHLEMEKEVANIIRVAEESIKIMSSTKNVSTYIKRMDTYKECLEQLQPLRDGGYKFPATFIENVRNTNMVLSENAINLIDSVGLKYRTSKRKLKPVYDMDKSIAFITVFSEQYINWTDGITLLYRRHRETGTPIEEVLDAYKAYKEWSVSTKGGADHLLSELCKCKKYERFTYCWNDVMYELENMLNPV